MLSDPNSPVSVQTHIECLLSDLKERIDTNIAPVVASLFTMGIVLKAQDVHPHALIGHISTVSN